MSWDKTTIIY